MKTLFITALTDIQVTGTLGRGILLSPSRLLTNDTQLVSSLLTPQFTRMVGLLETEALKNSGAVVYEIADMVPPPEPRPKRFGLLEQHLSLTQLLLLCLWLVKDNSVNFEQGFIEFPYKTSASTVSSNVIAALYSNAAGQFGTTTFTADEIRMARDHYTNLFGADEPGFALSHIGFTMPRDMTRLDRVIYYTQATRAAGNLGIKIANYITCFETLFSTDPSELAHKLSERIAVFVGDTSRERIAIYEQVKKAYGIRSKTVHGDRLTAQQEASAANLAAQCDVMLRRTLLKVLGSPELRKIFSGEPESLDAYMLGQLFSV